MYWLIDPLVGNRVQGSVYVHGEGWLNASFFIGGRDWMHSLKPDWSRCQVWIYEEEKASKGTVINLFLTIFLVSPALCIQRDCDLACCVHTTLQLGVARKMCSTWEETYSFNRITIFRGFLAGRPLGVSERLVSLQKCFKSSVMARATQRTSRRRHASHLAYAKSEPRPLK